MAADRGWRGGAVAVAKAIAVRRVEPVQALPFLDIRAPVEPDLG